MYIFFPRKILSLWIGRRGGKIDVRRGLITPSPPTKGFDFGGFDSSKLLILRGGNSHVR